MFSSKKLYQIKNISFEDVTKLEKAHVKTCHDFLISSPEELMGALKCSHTHYLKLVQLVSQVTAPHPQTAHSMYRSNKRHLSTSLPLIDSSLLGGLPPGTLTEIIGPSGCGKTQFCMMLTVRGCLPFEQGGLNTKVAYIDTEGSFAPRRLVEIAKSRYPQYYKTEDKIKEMTAKVLIYRELACSELNKRLDTLDLIVASESIGLIILDSIASLLRKEFDTRSSKGIFDRSSQLSKQATLLKWIAEDYQIPVVVTNQITTRFVPETCPDARLVVASLGNFWSHCVNTRLSMEFWDNGKRKLSIAKSPVGGAVCVIVSLEDKGLVMDMNDTEQLDTLEGDTNKYSLTVRTEI